MKFRLAYQPIVDLEANSPCRAVESLLRVPDGRGGYVDPPKFLTTIRSVSERRAFTWSIINRAIAEFRDVAHVGGYFASTVALNVNVSDLEDPSFASRLIEVLALSSLENSSVDVEISEMNHLTKDAVATIFDLGYAGVGISLDDFGVGCATLDWLAGLPVSSVKIDKTFIQNAMSSQRYRRVLEHLVSLVREMELPVIAEGIETSLHLDIARSSGCSHGQGYLFGAPAFCTPARYAS